MGRLGQGFCRFILGVSFLLLLTPLLAQAGSPGGPGGPPRPGGSGAVSALGIAAEDSRSRMIQVGGRLRPAVSIEHSTTAAGVVREVFVAPGDRVAEGTPLFSVDRNEAGQSFRLVTVRSRISGVISSVSADPEQEVSAGEAVVTVIDRSGYVLEAQISDKDAFKVSLGQQVRAATAEGVLFSGKLSNRSPEPDYATGLYSLRFDFPPSGDIHPGTFVLVDLPADTLSGFFVPADAVDRRYGRNFLWLVDKEKKVLIRREIVLGGSMGSDVLVLQGLKPGDNYLLKPSGRERDGEPFQAPAKGSP